MSDVAVLYDVPGPRARVRNLLLSVVAILALLAIAWFVYDRFDAKDQWRADLWKPLVQGDVWTNYFLPGLSLTLRAFAVGSVLALAFGFIFGVGRMSDSAPIRWASGIVVEFFRAIPLLLLMFFLYYGQTFAGIRPASIYWAVVLGLMLYNGSVLAEIIRAGVNSLARGQREAGQAIGLTSGQVMRTILLPQAVRAMLPAIIAQLVVLLKDTALGYILGLAELLHTIDQMNSTFQNVMQAAIMVAAIYIVINMTLGWLATWVERRLSRAKKGGPVLHPSDAAIAAIPGAAATGGDQGASF